MYFLAVLDVVSIACFICLHFYNSYLHKKRFRRFMIQCADPLLLLVPFCCLPFFPKRNSDQKPDAFSNRIFELSFAYQVLENLRVTKLLTPVLLAHFVIYSLYIFFNIVLQWHIQSVTYLELRTILIYLYVSSSLDNCQLPGRSLLHSNSSDPPPFSDYVGAAASKRACPARY